MSDDHAASAALIVTSRASAALIAASQKTGSLGICASFVTTGMDDTEISQLAAKVVRLSNRVYDELEVLSIPIPLRPPSTLDVPVGNVFVITITDEPLNDDEPNREAFVRYVTEFGGAGLLFVFPPPEGDDAEDDLESYLRLSLIVDSEFDLHTNLCAVRDPPDIERHGVWCGRVEVFSDA